MLLSSVNQKMRMKMQVTQKKRIRFCLKLDSRQHIGAKEFKEIRWQPTKETREPCVATSF